MARISDLAFRHRLLLGAYRFRRIDPVPWTLPSRPLRELRVALVTTAGLRGPGDAPFDEDARGGDTSFRVLRVRDPGGGAAPGVHRLRMEHRSTAFDPSGIDADRELALPVDRFLELEAEGVLGALHEDALSFMGSITAPGRLVRESAPAAAELLAGAGVEAAFLCPV